MAGSVGGLVCLPTVVLIIQIVSKGAGHVNCGVGQ